MNNNNLRHAPWAKGACWRVVFNLLLQPGSDKESVDANRLAFGSKLKRITRNVAVVFALSLIGSINASPADAQIIPDDTLGLERSSISSGESIRGLPAELIQGGATRGSNLFHSFSEFNVNEGQRVYFANPDGIANILSRVTGFTESTIDGLLGVDGGANLFLLNPNGIVFGPNAELDVGGSFTASTASSMAFPDGREFSATNPEDGSLLSVNVPLGVQFGPGPQGDITHEGNLAVGAGQELTLYGNTVRSTGALTAPGGTVQVLGERIGLTETAEIDVSAAGGGGTVLIGGDYRGEGEVPTALRTYVGPDVVINADALDSGDGGEVIIWADEATGFYGVLTARGGVNSGNGGFAEVSSPIFLEFWGRTDLSAINGQFGIFLLDPRNITVVQGPNNPSDLPSGSGNEILFDDKPGENTTINNGTIDAQQSNVILQATENIIFDAPVSLSTVGVGLTALSGNDIKVNEPILTNLGVINLTAVNSITINANVSSRGGDIFLSAERLTVEPESHSSQSAVVQTTPEQFGLRSGNLTIDSREVRILNAGQLAVDTLGSEDSGNINIQNAEVVEVSGIGFNPNGEPIQSTIRVQVGGIGTNQDGLAEESTGKGGTLNVNTRSFLITNGGLVTASTFSEGDSGSISIHNAELVEVSGVAIDSNGNIIFNREGQPVSSTLRAQVEQNAAGNGGEININSNIVKITNGGLLTTSTFDRGAAGNINIQNAELVEISGRDSFLRAQVDQLPDQPTAATGNGGDLLINTRELRIINEGAITVSSVGEGSAGNIEIETYTLFLNNGDLIATSRSGTGGNISIQSRSLDQEPFLILMLDNSDVSAQAFENATGGNVQINDNTQFNITPDGFVDGNNPIKSPNNIQPLGFILASQENNNILANAGRGRGGIIRINAFAIFGLEERAPLTQFSDINASSEEGLDGEVLLNTLNIDPTRGLGELPIDIVDASNLVAEGCIGSNRDGVDDQGEFTRSGRGGFSPGPSDVLNDDTLIDPSAPPAEADQSAIPAPESSIVTNQPLIEAQGLAHNGRGQVSLVSGSANLTTSSPLSSSNPCDAP